MRGLLRKTWDTLTAPPPANPLSEAVAEAAKIIATLPPPDGVTAEVERRILQDRLGDAEFQLRLALGPRVFGLLNPTLPPQL